MQLPRGLSLKPRQWSVMSDVKHHRCAAILDVHSEEAPLPPDGCEASYHVSFSFPLV